MKTARRKKGMTLLEVMVSFAILMVVIMSVFPLIDRMVGQFQTARDHYIATSLGQSRIERARMAPFSDLMLFSEPPNNPTYLNDLGAIDPGGRFRRITILSTNSPSAGLTTMTVTTHICLCSQYGWRKAFHPIRSTSFSCKFTDEREEMSYIFTYYNQ